MTDSSGVNTSLCWLGVEFINYKFIDYISCIWGYFENFDNLENSDLQI